MKTGSRVSCCPTCVRAGLRLKVLILCVYSALSISAQPGQVTVRSRVLADVEAQQWTMALQAIHNYRMSEDPELQSDPELFAATTTALLKSGDNASFQRLLSLQTGGLQPAVLFLTGTKLARAKLYANAVELLTRVPASDADDAVCFNLALALSHLSRFDAARENYFRAIDAHPWHLEAYFHIGLDYAAEAQPNFAIPWLSQALKLAPTRSDIGYALAEQMISLKYLDSARQLVAAGKAGEQDSAPVFTLQGQLTLATGDTAGARSYFDKALAANSKFVPALLGRGRVAASASDPLAAKNYFSKAQALDPEGPAQVELGKLAISAGKWDEAVRYLQPACERSCSTEARLDLARSFRQGGKAEEGLAVLMKQSDPVASIPWHVELLQIYRRLGRSDQAAQEAATVQKLQSRPEEALTFDAPKTYVQ